MSRFAGLAVSAVLLAVLLPTAAQAGSAKPSSHSCHPALGKPCVYKRNDGTVYKKVSLLKGSCRTEVTPLGTDGSRQESVYCIHDTVATYMPRHGKRHTRLLKREEVLENTVVYDASGRPIAPPHADCYDPEQGMHACP